MYQLTVNNRDEMQVVIGSVLDRFAPTTIKLNNTDFELKIIPPGFRTEENQTIEHGQFTGRDFRQPKWLEPLTDTTETTFRKRIVKAVNQVKRSPQKMWRPTK